jgi:hypothetical protein
MVEQLSLLSWLLTRAAEDIDAPGTGYRPMHISH